MATTPPQSDPTVSFEPDPVHGFAYCRELPPDVPPGMTLDHWRLAHHCRRRHHLPRLRPGIHAHHRHARRQRRPV